MIPFYDSYGAVIAWVFGHGLDEVNLRTKTRVKVGRGGMAFRIDLSDGLLPTIGFRKTFPKSAAAEVAWYLQGSQDATFIRKYAPLWDKFVETIPLDPEMGPCGPSNAVPMSASFKVLERRVGDRVIQHEGPLSFEGVVSAYGYRWRNHFGRDQIRLAIEALREDPTDRRVLVSAWDPMEDGLGATGQKNVPCPASFTFSTQGKELHSSLFLRSSDVFVGLPYDVMGHALLMDAMAHELRLRPGIMQVTLAHAHLYETHWAMTAEMMKQEPVVPPMPLPGWSLSQIERAPDDYVCRYAEEAKVLAWPAFNPKPMVVE